MDINGGMSDLTGSTGRPCQEGTVVHDSGTNTLGKSNIYQHISIIRLFAVPELSQRSCIGMLFNDHRDLVMLHKFILQRNVCPSFHFSNNRNPAFHTVVRAGDGKSQCKDLFIWKLLDHFVHCMEHHVHDLPGILPVLNTGSANHNGFSVQIEKSYREILSGDPDPGYRKILCVQGDSNGAAPLHAGEQSYFLYKIPIHKVIDNMCNCRLF